MKGETRSIRHIESFDISGRHIEIFDTSGWQTMEGETRSIRHVETSIYRYIEKFDTVSNMINRYLFCRGTEGETRSIRHIESLAFRYIDISKLSIRYQTLSIRTFYAVARRAKRVRYNTSRLRYLKYIKTFHTMSSIVNRYSLSLTWQGEIRLPVHLVEAEGTPRRAFPPEVPQDAHQAERAVAALRHSRSPRRAQANRAPPFLILLFLAVVFPPTSHLLTRYP